MNTQQMLALILMTVLLFAANGDNLRGQSLDFEENKTDANDEHRQLKWNAAQKRQFRRDKRRQITNPNRSQREEHAERWRKHQQAINRGNSRADPYEPAHGGRQFMRARRNGKYYRKNDRRNPHWWPNEN